MIMAYSTDTLNRVAHIISRGGVIGFRTDTFYGLGADPFNRDAVQRIKALKGRDDRKPILIVISDHQQVTRFIPNASAAFNNLAQIFWPGPLTLIGHASTNVTEEITAGTGTIGVRLPDDENVSALINACGGALTATSANPGQLAAGTSAQMVADY